MDNPERCVCQRETMRELARAMERLTDKQRAALELWMEELTQEEAGEALGINQRNAGRRIYRAIEALRAAFI